MHFIAAVIKEKLSKLSRSILQDLQNAVYSFFVNKLVAILQQMLSEFVMSGAASVGTSSDIAALLF